MSFKIFVRLDVGNHESLGISYKTFFANNFKFPDKLSRAVLLLSKVQEQCSCPQKFKSSAPPLKSFRSSAPALKS
jgi:hypothetical protein